VEERANIWIGAAIGALVGAAVGFLFFTGRGARVRRDLVTGVVEATDHLAHVEDLVARVRDASSAGLASVSRLFAEAATAPEESDARPPSRPDVAPEPRLH